MRTNPAGVTEVAHLRTNKANYDEGYERIFGKKDQPKENKEPEDAELPDGTQDNIREDQTSNT